MVLLCETPNTTASFLHVSIQVSKEGVLSSVYCFIKFYGRFLRTWKKVELSDKLPSTHQDFQADLHVELQLTL